MPLACVPLLVPVPHRLTRALAGMLPAGERTAARRIADHLPIIDR
jgi:hypothetical protein